MWILKILCRYDAKSGVIFTHTENSSFENWLEFGGGGGIA